MDGMVIFGAVVAGLALLGIVLAYSWGEAKTPGWGWKKQIEDSSAGGSGATGTESSKPATSSPEGQAVEAPGTSVPAGKTATPEEELEQAVQEASKEREGSLS